MKRVTKPDGEYTSVANQRLKAYEDTGMEPEDILSAKDMAKVACALHELNQYKDLGDLDYLRELVEADRDQEFQRHLKRFDNVLPKKPHWIEQMDRDAIQRWLTRSLTTNGISEDRLREICEADRDGRIVVLPCKIGETVWRIYDDCEFPGDCGTKRMCRGCEYRNLFTEAQAFCLSMLSQNGNLEHPYYMSIKAAEAALKSK